MFSVGKTVPEGAAYSNQPGTTYFGVLIFVVVIEVLWGI